MFIKEIKLENFRNYDFTKIEKVLEKHNLPSDVRAENIPLEVFVHMSNEL